MVKSPSPVKIKYGRKESFQNEHANDKNSQQEDIRKKQSIVDKLNQVVDYVKNEDIETIIDNAVRSIDNFGKTPKDMTVETRNKYFENCTAQNQLLVEMRHAGWNKEIKVFNRDWALAYSGSAYFRSRIKNASIDAPFDEHVFSVRECNPNEYKWELFPNDRYNRMMEKIEIDFSRGEHIIISFVPSIKKEIYKIPIYGWKIEFERLNRNFVVNDANGRQFAKVYSKLSSKHDIYVIDYFDDDLKQILLAITIAMDLCRSGYEPRTFREK